MADDGEGVRGCHDDGGLVGNQREGWDSGCFVVGIKKGGVD